MMPTHIIRSQQGRRIMNRLALRLVCMGYVAIALAAPLGAAADEACAAPVAGICTYPQCTVSNVVPGADFYNEGTFSCTSATGLVKAFAFSGETGMEKFRSAREALIITKGKKCNFKYRFAVPGQPHVANERILSGFQCGFL